MNTISPCRKCGIYCTEHGRWEVIEANEPSPEIRYAVYVRLPMARNPENIVSVPRLLDAAEDYACALGGRVTHEFVDYGTSEGECPAWFAFMREAGRIARPFDHVLVVDRSQISHNSDTVTSSERKLNGFGIRIKSMTDGPYKSQTALLAAKILAAFEVRRCEHRAARRLELRKMRNVQKAQKRAHRHH